jgi:hypothetical protein
VDAENGIVGVQKENNLQEPLTTPPAPDHVLPVATVPGPGGFHILDDPFRLFRIDAVFGDVPGIPVVPAKLHPLTEARVTCLGGFFNKK